MTFVEWVVTRKAGDNPRGDFIRDTRFVVECGRASEDEIRMRMRTSCWEAAKEYQRLFRQFIREGGDE